MQKGFGLLELLIVLVIVATVSVFLKNPGQVLGPEATVHHCDITVQDAQQKVMEQLFYADEVPEICP